MQTVPASTIDACPRRAVCLAFLYRAKPYEAAWQELPSMDKTRVSVYIDGINLYHSTLQHEEIAAYNRLTLL